jgi:hypothetical protein
VQNLAARVSRAEPEHRTSAIHQAIDEVMEVVEGLKRALDQMEEVLELVELAERQKLADEREIESLRRALRQLNERTGDRPREFQRESRGPRDVRSGSRSQREQPSREPREEREPREPRGRRDFREPREEIPAPSAEPIEQPPEAEEPPQI